MWLFDLFKDSSDSSKKEIQKKYVGNEIHITFPTSNGEYVVIVDSISTPDGMKGVMYDCFLVAARQWQRQGMREDDFIKDMKEVMRLITEGNDNDSVMKTLLRQHISQTGRLIDTDLCTYISELYLALIAVNGYCDRNLLLDQMMQVAERNFGDKLFITRYRRNGWNIQPFLVPFSEFIRKQ